MNNDKERKANLVEIRDILRNEMDKFHSINSEMVDNQNDFGKIGINYHKYSNEIDKAREHITKLKKREFFENLFVYIGFVFFFICVGIVMLRRFPFHKIVINIGKAGVYIGRKTYGVVNAITGTNRNYTTNSTMNNYTEFKDNL